MPSSFDWTILKWAGFALLLVAAYGLGNVHATRWALEHQQTMDAADKKSALAGQKKADAKVAAAATPILFILSNLPTNNGVLQNAIPKYLPQRPAPRPADYLSNGFVLLHNYAATGTQPPAGPPDDVGAASSVDPATAIRVISSNYAGCLGDKARLEFWQNYFQSLGGQSQEALAAESAAAVPEVH